MQIGLIGAGNMARALARGWGRPVLCFDPVAERAQALAEETGGEALASGAEVARRADLVVLCHKPAQLEAVAAEIAPHARAVASILAATPLAALREAYPGLPVYRFMPSLPVEVRQGAVVQAADGGGVSASGGGASGGGASGGGARGGGTSRGGASGGGATGGGATGDGTAEGGADGDGGAGGGGATGGSTAGADPALDARVHALFAELGSLVVLDDSLLDVAMGLMSCGPAYVALVAEAQIDAGVRRGIPAPQGARLVVQTLAGTAELLRRRDYDTLAVRREVSSPGGLTARGLDVLERWGVRAAFSDALDAVLRGGRPRGRRRRHEAPR